MMLRIRKTEALLIVGMVLIIVLCFFSISHAGTVQPHKKGGNDTPAIQKELDKTGYVKLVSGKTYHINSRIIARSNASIDATGATMLCKSYVLIGGYTKSKYTNLKNFSMKGGLWKSTKKKGFKKSTMKFAHASNLRFENMTILTTNYEGHAIELVGCDTVTVYHCIIKAQGKPKKTSVEEMIQLDVASKTTAPFLSAKLRDGKPCSNITVEDCVITGSRAVCSNFTKKEKKWRNQFHSNVVIKDCTLTGVTSEALALFNTANATITGNTLISNSPRKSSSYSTGCHITWFGTVPSQLKEGSFYLSDNVIKGGRYGLLFYSHTSSQFANVHLENNTCYAKLGKSVAIRTASVKSLTDLNNSRLKW